MEFLYPQIYFKALGENAGRKRQADLIKCAEILDRPGSTTYYSHMTLTNPNSDGPDKAKLMVWLQV
jgi:hypothetical protein